MELLHGLAALAALAALVVAWLAGALVGDLLLELVLGGVRLVVRPPLYALDQAAAFWLFLASPSFRDQQLAVLRTSPVRGLWLLKTAFSVLCGLTLAGALFGIFTR